MELEHLKTRMLWPNSTLSPLSIRLYMHGGARITWNGSKLCPQERRFGCAGSGCRFTSGSGSAWPFCSCPISLSGAALVWHDHLDALVNPGRYAVTAGEPLRPSATACERAAAALGRGFQPVVVRMPESAGWPATVTAREPRRGEGGGRPRFLTVYLDPPTGRVLDVDEFRNSLIGFLHRFHENLTIPEYSGRAIVGWSGVGDADPVAQRHLSVVAAQRRLPARACAGRADPRCRSTCIICSASGFRFRSPSCRRPASISAFRSRGGNCCRRSRR